MVKPRTQNVTKSKKKITQPDEKRGFVVYLIHKWLPTVIVSIFSIILALAAFELGLQIFAKKHYDTSACQSLDNRFHHVMIPKSVCRDKTDEWDITYKINSMGLRDEEISPEKDKTFRILLLGDSFAQGYGVEAKDSFGEILESNLNDAGGRKYEVINAGVFGYSPIVEYLYLKKEGLFIHPDLVIMAFTLTDFYEDRQRFSELSRSYPEASEGEILGKIENGQIEFVWEKINPVHATSSEISELYETTYKVKRSLKDNLKTYKLIADFRDKQRSDVAQDVSNLGDIDLDILALVRGEKIRDSDWQNLWELPIRHLALMKGFLDKGDIPFLVVSIPDAFAVSDREWPGRKSLGIADDFSDPRGDWQDELTRRLKELGIGHINLLLDFRKSDIFPLYFSNDGHFREAGHELAASVIFTELVKYLNR